jgi:hypothetical protein
MTKMGWAGVEQTRGVINHPEGSQFYIVTSERIHLYEPVGEPMTYVGNLGIGTKPGGGGSISIDIAAPTYPLLSAGLMRDSRLLVDGNWHTVASVANDTRIFATNDSNPFTAKAVHAYNKNFTGLGNGWYGPRYCWFGEDLIIINIYGTCVFPLNRATNQLYFGAFNHKNRGLDIINFAGRPVLLGAFESTGDYGNQTTTFGSDMLRWPTRSDYRDWDSYGSGFLYLHTDGSGIRCGENWGEDAYVFTGTSIYQLIETGIDAANPIAFHRHQARLPSPPNSNAVRGLRGIYFWTRKGPMMFDGNVVHDLTQELELDLDTYDSSLLNEGVHVWRDEYTQTIRFHNHKLPCATLQYIFWEGPGDWTTLDEDALYLAGTGNLYDLPVGVKSTSIVTDTVVSRLQKEDQGTEDMVPDQDFLCRASWRGMTTEEGPHINKTIQQIRVMFTMVLSTNDDADDPTLGCSIVPDVQDDTIPDANIITVDITPSESIQWHTFTPLYKLEAPVWRMDIHFPAGTKIYQICIDYHVGGDVEGDI